VSPDAVHTTAAAEAAAARWLARRESGMSESDAAAFTRWLGADPIHAEQWRRAEALWTALGDALADRPVSAPRAESGRLISGRAP
jgi:transmembrane sensor